MPIRRVALVVLAAALAFTALAAPASAAQRYRYPLRGAHNYGDLAVTGFGVKRSNGTIHLGQDIIASCGTPIVAAHDGVVKSVGYSDGYGNYVVIGGKGTRFDFVYGHMKGRAKVRVNKKVHVGQRLGSVGQTGSDSGVCHLHFEMWKGRWFAGGTRTDPLPHLRAWDKFSGGPLQTGPIPVGQDSFKASKRLFYDGAE
jgi:murein DD-endopeptidase MepM/ murein hydrolase activator NlpD